MAITYAQQIKHFKVRKKQYDVENIIAWSAEEFDEELRKGNSIDKYLEFLNQFNENDELKIEHEFHNFLSKILW